MIQRVLHISESNEINGGGIYFYLKEFINIQKESGIDCFWITIKEDNLLLNQKELLNTYPPSLTNYYKEKVDNYFNSLIKEDL